MLSGYHFIGTSIEKSWDAARLSVAPNGVRFIEILQKH